MPRTPDREPSVRVTLGRLLYGRAKNQSSGIVDIPILLDSPDSSTIGAGTPNIPAERHHLRPFWMVRAAFENGMQTIAKTRNVHITPMEAYLSQGFGGFDQVRVTLLALNLIQIVEAKDLIRGYSSVYVAAACTVAAQKALDTTLLHEDGLVLVGVVPCAVISAYLKLKTQMSESLKMIKAVKAAQADSGMFPGRPLISSKMP